MNCLNLGCGDRFRAEWENLDHAPTSPRVHAHDLRNGIPFPDGTFDVVYHSHVLEHFPKRNAPAFVQECHRVLKTGGTIRVAVPDLERIARLYLESLEKASLEIPGWADNYDWMLMELYDQAVREKSCGALVEYFNRNPIPNWDFVQQRWGVFVIPLLKSIQQNAASTSASPKQIAWGYIFRHPADVLRGKLLRLLLSPADLEALRVGRFRSSGEIHMWMYDAYSLARLLQEAGFTDPQRLGPAESRIPGWVSFNLDTEPDGRIYKADSLYMEAVKS